MRGAAGVAAGSLVVLATLLASCAERSILDDVAAASRAVSARRYEEALVLVDGVRRSPDLPEVNRDSVEELRIVSLAGLGRRDEMIESSQALAARRGGLKAKLVARAGLEYLESGGAFTDLELLLAELARDEDATSVKLREALAERAERLAAERMWHEGSYRSEYASADGKSDRACAFCSKPGCNFDCIKLSRCEFD